MMATRLFGRNHLRARLQEVIAKVRALEASLDELQATRRELETTKQELETLRREQETSRREEEILWRSVLAIYLVFLIIAVGAIAGVGIALGHWWGYLVAAATLLLIVLTVRLLLQWLAQRPRPSK
jgi:hypothetical protein